MKYGVVILSFNHPEITAQCVRSVLKFETVRQIFLVHNGSLEKHIQYLQQQFPDIEHLIIPQNKGFTGGANFGIAQALKKFQQVLFLTNDTILLQLPTEIDTDLCSVQVYKRKSERIDSVMGELNTMTGRLSHLKNWPPFEANQMNRKYYVPGSAFWISQKAFNLTNGFDESLHSYWEDVDLSLRAQKLGLKLSYSNETCISHKIGKTTGGQDYYSYYLYQRNRKKVMQKHELTQVRFWIAFAVDVLRLSRLRWQKTLSIFLD